MKLESFVPDINAWRILTLAKKLNFGHTENVVFQSESHIKSNNSYSTQEEVTSQK